MKVSEIRYARKFNTGNYESEEYAVTAIVEEDDSAKEVFKQLKQEITAAHSGEQSGEESEEETATEDKPTRRRGSKKGKGSNSDKGEAETETEEETEEVEGEEESETESGNEEEDDSQSESEESEDEETTEKPPKKSARSTGGAAAGKGKKGFKKKPQVYQRTNPRHKDVFSSVLKEVFPTWKKDDKTKAKGKMISQKMEGEEFLDENGKVLASFKQSAKKLAAKK